MKKSVVWLAFDLNVGKDYIAKWYAKYATQLLPSVEVYYKTV